ncbi:hypothetical protein K7432_003156 [Basidiobolus ranarum]|uniref:FZ domain-containing protein n=1 Tax=Basidiobolus ranarum TaxID=34480 RepID=A0ABR2W6N6_9FUNG
MTFKGYSLIFGGALVTFALGNYCGPLSNSSSICQEVNYNTIVNNTEAAEASVKALLNKISREGYESANAPCFLAIREALCSITYRKCNSDTLVIHPVCPLVRNRAITVCNNTMTYLDKSILEDNIDGQAFQNSSDCFVYSAATSAPSPSLPTPIKDALVNSTLQTQNIYEGVNATILDFSSVAMESLEDIDASLESSATNILLPMKVNEVKNGKFSDHALSYRLVSIFVSVILIGGLISVGVVLLLWKLRRRRNLIYDQVWEADEEQEVKQLETRHLTTSVILSPTFLARLSHEIFVVADSDGSDMDTEPE